MGEKGRGRQVFRRRGRRGRGGGRKQLQMLGQAKFKDITTTFCFKFSCNLECSWRSHMHVKYPVVHVKSLVDYSNIKITQHALKGVRGLKLDAIKKKKKKKKKKKEQCFRKQPSVRVDSGNHSRPPPVVPGAQQTAPWAVLRAAPPPPTLLPSVPTEAHGLHSGETALTPAPLLTLTAVEKSHWKVSLIHNAHPYNTVMAVQSKPAWRPSQSNP